MNTFNDPIGEDYGQWQLTFSSIEKWDRRFTTMAFCYILWKIAKNPPTLFRLAGQSIKKGS